MKTGLQKHVRAFLLITNLLGAMNIGAQTWTSPMPAGSVITDGAQYYVYNVGAKAFFDRGGEWANQAIVTPSTGILVTAVQSAPDWVLQLEVATKTLYRSDVSNGWTYTDKATDNTWDIQLTDDPGNVYSIQAPSSYSAYNAAQYLGASTSTYSSNKEGAVYDVRYNRAASDYTKWILVAPADLARYNAQVLLDKYMGIAKTVVSNVDLTSYITTYNTGDAASIAAATATLKAVLAVTDNTSSILNADFSSNPATAGNGWTTASNSWTNGVCEYWRQNNKTLTQTISGLTAGVYVVTFQGFQRQTALNTAQHTNYGNGSDVLCGKMSLTASGTTTFIPLRSIYSETTCPQGTAVDGLKFPNSTGDAKAAFDAGLYQNELSTATVDGTGAITLALNVYYVSNSIGDWHVIDNFHLYYYAPESITTSQTALTLGGTTGTTTATFTVTGTGLSSANPITITPPAGISPDQVSIAYNASGEVVTVTYDDATNVNGDIILSNGLATASVAVTATPSATTGVEEANGKEIAVYPILSNGNVHVSQGGVNGSIKVYDLAGRLVLSKTASLKDETVALPSSGMFFFEVSDGKVTKKIKVVCVK